MGNYLKGVSDTALMNSFHSVLKYSGFSPDDYNINKVDINEKLNTLTEENKKLCKLNDNENYILQIDCFNDDDEEVKNKPKMLLIHGFGGCGPMFYRILGHLSKSFRVTTFDMLGLGGSGRPSFNLKTA